MTAVNIDAYDLPDLSEFDQDKIDMMNEQELRAELRRLADYFSHVKKERWFINGSVIIDRDGWHEYNTEREKFQKAIDSGEVYGGGNEMTYYPLNVKIPESRWPEMLRVAQIETELGSIACSNYSGGYAMITELFEKMLNVALKN